MPVDSMTTVSMRWAMSQSANASRSAVKHPKVRTGFGARSGGRATQWVSPPTSMAAALGWVMLSPAVGSGGDFLTGLDFFFGEAAGWATAAWAVKAPLSLELLCSAGIGGLLMFWLGEARPGGER